MDYENGCIASLLKTSAMHMFINLLENIKGSKHLILSSKLVALLDLICSFAALKSKGVEKIFKLESGQHYNSKIQCFVIRADLEETKLVSDSINMSKQRGVSDTQFWIIFVPRKLQICDEYLEKEGVYEYISILEYPLFLVPLDNDLFSLEFVDFYQNTFLFGQLSDIPNIANSLHQLEKLMGPFPNIYAKGKLSAIIGDMLSSFNSKSPKDIASYQSKSNIISDVIIYDRDEDYTPVFLSQLNYVGLLDEMFTIKCGKVEFGPEVTKSSENIPLKHNLQNNDAIFRDIQDFAFSSVFLMLKEKGQRIREKYNQRHDMSLSVMKDFVANELKNLQSEHRSLCLHLSASEIIMEHKKEINFAQQLRIEQNMIDSSDSKVCLNYIEDSIIRQLSPNISLRLLCIYSITHGGLNNKDYKNLLKLFLQSYGQQHMITFYNLQKLGILVENTNFNLTNQITANNAISIANKFSLTRSNDSIRKFHNNVKRFNLIPQINDQTYDAVNPKDAGYVFGGAYIPLICRIVELLMEKKNSEEFAKLVNGKFISNNNVGSINSLKPRVVLVFFVGGVTFAEISALRFVSKLKAIPIVIATSAIINGNNFLSQLMPN